MKAGTQEANEMEAPVVEDEELEEEDRDRPTLTELVAGCSRSSAAEVPSASALAAAVMRQIEVIAMRHDRIEDALEAVAFIWDWQERDMHVEQQTALQLLAESGELLDELRLAMFRWLGCVGRSSVVQLNDDAMAAAAEIIKEWQPWRRWAGNDLVGDCIKYVAANPGAIAAVRAADDRRWESLSAKCRRRGDRSHEAVEDRDDDNGRGADATKQADVDAITSWLRRANARFVSALRSDLEDPNARWSKYLVVGDEDSDGESEPVHADAPGERDDETRDDAADDTIDAIVFVGPEDGQPEDTLTAELSPGGYQALRHEVRGLVARFAAEHATSQGEPPSSEREDRPAGVAGRPGGDGENTATPSVQGENAEDKIAVGV